MPDISREDIEWLCARAADQVRRCGDDAAKERVARLADALKRIGRVEIVPRSSTPPAHVRQRLSARAKWAAIAQANAGGQA